jgi:pilus assembly protein CpaF
MTSPTLQVPLGLGPLQEHLDNPDVSEVMVLDGEHIWVEDPLGLRHVGCLTPAETSLCVDRIVRVSGRRLDLLSPVLDTRLADGSRACVVIPPIAVRGPTISIRKFTRRILPLAAFGPENCTNIVRQLVEQRVNIVISGATSSGKTSLLTSASKSFSINERIVCVEDTAELRFAHPHVVRLQTRPANAEGDGEVSMQQLVRASLRLRPDRLVVGEVRGSEVVDMLLALSSGHQGCWSTVHATSAPDTLNRLSSLILRDSPQWNFTHAQHLIHSAVGAVIHVQRTAGQRRVISEILHVAPEGTSPLYKAVHHD